MGSPLRGTTPSRKGCTRRVLPPCPGLLLTISRPCFSLSALCLDLPMGPFPVLPRMMSSASHPRRYSYEDQGFRCHTQVRDHRKCSGDGSFKEPLESKGRSHSKIQSFSDSFEQQLCFRTKRSVSLGPESRKERNERERRFLEVRSCKKVEEKRSSRKEEHGEAYLPTLSEKALK
ncbi:leukemia NUP98 fusion partner 1 isoform X3 [Bos javanicus]|uniref:leukemia NUP98 fusion partner 1 isoform X3 n=1 Tax=Bos taurus TaxID=9913 RepID=UPI0028CB8E1A|nr:leukemia NUP98 fusion partner 1 isoform X3 [Bos taurus]XP_061238289.1 leukemia NUP98 fusion partner 1 isoform X3 [Bos javanicus]